jgi:hypothetical protein
MPLIHFLKYNNAFPIAVSIMLLGAGGAFAATNPEALYSSEQHVLSVDNTYLVNKDLSQYTPKIQITGVTEDTDNYYVAYNFYTLDAENYVWKDVVNAQTLTVAKPALAQEHDLGVYATRVFGQMIDHELERLRQTQHNAQENVSQKVVATTYSGLVGKFLDDTTEVLPGYTPVVGPPAGDSSQTASAAGSSGAVSVTAPTAPQGSAGSSPYLSLQLLGNNPAKIALHTSYIDLGVVLLDPTTPNIGYQTYFDGVRNETPSVDTSTTSVHRIEYQATDHVGNTVMVRRIIIVGDAPDPGGEISFAGAVTPIAPPPPPPSAPTPTPAPVEPTATTTATTTIVTDQPTSTATTTDSSTTTTTSSDTATSTATSTP